MIPDTELMIEISTYRTEEKGGQQVGVVPTGVRVTHIPSNLSVFCDAARSQMKNRDIAVAMIEWGLLELNELYPHKYPVKK